ncbi:hypothetical protein D9M69_642480 [compost metagenome]
MRDRAVGLREQAHDVECLAPVGAAAAELVRNAQGQQATGAQRIALGFRRAAALVAFDRGRGEAFHEFACDVAVRFGNRNGKNGTHAAPR